MDRIEAKFALICKTSGNSKGSLKSNATESGKRNIGFAKS